MEIVPFVSGNGLLALALCVRHQPADAVKRPLVPRARLDLNTVSCADALHDFRFTVAEIRRIVCSLRLPDVVVTSERDRCLADEAMSMLLMRLVFPARLSLLRKTFGRSEPACCRIILHIGK